MPSIKIPTPVRPYTEGKQIISIEGETVGEALSFLLSLHPELKEHFYKEDGQLSRFANIFLGNKHIITLQDLETPLLEEDILRIIPSIAGGIDL